MELITIEKDGATAIMTWRHERQNQFTTPFLTENIEALNALAADITVNGVVITSGDDKYFSTGLHLAWMIQVGQEDPTNVLRFLQTLNSFLKTLTGFPKPLVAAINGHAVAAGCISAACMDYRLMRQDKGLVSLPEVQIDIPFWPGMTAIFKDILPPASFRDMAYTGQRFTSVQANELGYIDRVCPLDELLPAALDLARQLGQANWETYATIKRGLRQRVLDIMEHDDPKAIEQFIFNMQKSNTPG